MLKEKLYIEYQIRYKDYVADHKKVDELKSDVESMKHEGKAKKESLENEKAKTLKDLKNRKTELEYQLNSVKKDGTGSRVFQEYSESKLKNIKTIEDKIVELKSKKKSELKDLETKKKEAVSDLEADKDLCQKRLDDLMSGGDGSEFVKRFDEKQLRQKLGRDKDQQVSKLNFQYDGAILKIQNSLQNVDCEYSAILQRELAYVENDEQLQGIYYGLNSKMSSNELPAVISDSLSEPVEGVISRQGLKGGQSVARLSSMANTLDDLRQYTPGWLVNLVTFGLPAIAGVILFLAFIVTGASLSFVTTATNIIVTFIFRILCAAIGFGIVYGFLGTAKGKTAGIIGGVIVGMICFVISLGWAITLPYSVTNAVEWIVKIIICIAAGIGLFFLNTNTAMGDSLINTGMKFQFVRKAALERQGYSIQENVDSYYTLLRYREIISAIVEANKQERTVFLKNEILRLESDKETSVSALIGKIDQNIERTVASERASADASRKQYEQNQMDLIQRQDTTMLELSEYDGKIASEKEKYDKRISSIFADFDQKISDNQDRLQKLKNSIISDKDSLIKQLEQDISDCDDDSKTALRTYDEEISRSVDLYSSRIAETEKTIRELQNGFKSEFDAINELFMKIYKSGSPELEETEGVVSDKFYVFDGGELSQLQEAINKSPDNTGSLTPVRLYEVKHNKNPIVFLYDSMDSSKIATELHDFMDAINIGLYTINCNKIYELYITDPVSKGINFKDQERQGRLHIIDDIKELYNIISKSMDFIAAKGHQLTIDELNRNLIKDGNDEEDINKFGLYRVVQFIIPEEDSNQTTDFFNNDIWTKFETCKKHGFLPIFYIKRTEWNNALNNNEKFNSKFITKLNKALGSDKDQKNIYLINTHKIAIARYER
ncbi:MAG: hypothetical protein HFG54_02095 [Lachnospiraceae bacterium]|jgi:hypothetical protein|nr:hypothetical protein [Lachnospiraceae bacterium]